MFKRGLLTAAAVFTATGAAAQVSPAQLQRSAANIQAHVSFLASDLLKGREPGTPEFDIAASYVASQMQQLGLKPGGAKGSYFQPVPMVAYRLTEPGSLTLKDASGRETPLVFGTDYTRSGDARSAEVKQDAGLVFVGYGVVAPEQKRDDYAGLDVKGKIVVMLQGAPRYLQTEERAFYGYQAEKTKNAEAHGAVAVIVVRTLTNDRLGPFATAHRSSTQWSMNWRTADGKPFTTAGIASLGTVNTAALDKLLAGSGHTAQEVLAAADTDRGEVKGFALPQNLRAAGTRTEYRNVESENVVGVLEGSDPKLKSEYVVLSAHLDHLGLVQPINGDNIANGALDNASGVATTLEAARFFRDAGGKAPKRSVIFLVVTGEEKGLVGSDYFARNPTVPLSRIVADVDLDMPILLYDFTDLVAFGAERSTVGDSVRRAAGRMGLKLSPDPMPDEGIFTRSDHYRFVQQGVPAVFLITGYANGGEKAFKDFMDTHYHKPSDDLNLPLRWDVGAKYAQVNYEITRELADGAARPAWKPGDFFGVKYTKVTADQTNAPPPRETEVGASKLARVLLPAKGDAALTVQSPAFRNLGNIPFENTQYRGNFFPGLSWSKGPAGTVSYAVILQDGDALVGGADPVLHWTMYDVPAAQLSLPDSMTTPPVGASFGPNVRGTNYPYVGPRSGPGPKHRYHFQVFALDKAIGADPKLTYDQLKAAMTGHVLASGEVIGLGQFDPTAPPPAPPAPAPRPN